VATHHSTNPGALFTSWAVTSALRRSSV